VIYAVDWPKRNRIQKSRTYRRLIRGPVLFVVNLHRDMFVTCHKKAARVPTDLQQNSQHMVGSHVIFHAAHPITICVTLIVLHSMRLQHARVHVTLVQTLEK
jgi:hypothetical protein